jgi:hypothetical protein
VYELVLYNSDGVALMSLTDDIIIDLAIVGMDLTVRALTQGPVDQVDFFFDGKSVTSEEKDPYYLFQDDRDGIGIPYAPLAVPGKHTVSAVAELNGERTGYQSATFQVISS